jgi:hypothetical protein
MALCIVRHAHRISHETLYRYDAPAFGVIQTLRLTPSNTKGSTF